MENKTNITNAHTILSNAKVAKLNEYRLSYGQPQTIEVPFVKVFVNEIHLINEVGTVIRVMKRGTKVLKSFTGTEISEKAFKTRINESKKSNQNVAFYSAY